MFLFSPPFSLLISTISPTGKAGGKASRQFELPCLKVEFKQDDGTYADVFGGGFKQLVASGSREQPKLVITYDEACTAGIQHSFLSLYNSSAKGDAANNKNADFVKKVTASAAGDFVSLKIDKQDTTLDSITALTFNGDAVKTREDLLKRFRLTIWKDPHTSGGL